MSSATRDVNDRLTKLAAYLMAECVEGHDTEPHQIIFTFTAKRSARGAQISKISLEAKNERD